MQTATHPSTSNFADRDKHDNHYTRLGYQSVSE